MEPPSFAGGPEVLRATPGSDTGLVLPLPSGTPPFQFEWSRAGAKLSERFTSSHNAGGVRLSITAARTGDSGVYTLQASNAAGKDSTRVRLEVSPDEMPTGDDPPTFLRRLQDLTVKVGTRTRFLVEIVSSTECRVTWYRNERRLMEAERIALVRDGNFWCADISAVSVDDAGRWTCTAENIGGRASCSAHLNVLVPKAYKRPEFVEELRALLTEQGTVSLECKVVGVPTPVLRWFKDSREIKAGDVFALTANAEDPTSLGTYTCEAVNCMGRAYSSSKVQVVGRASREGSTRPSSGGVMLEPPPIFTKELEDQFVRICERLTLSCKIVVPPWPRTVVWYNKEGKVEANDKYHILEDGVGGYFIEIQTSEFPDEGEWKCVATSAGGRVGISTCYVSMDIPKNYRKPRFMENLQAVLTEEGLVSFECKVVGFPTPVLSWFKDGQELKPGDVYQLTGTNSLGSYCCIARNFMGQASSSAELTVEDIQNQLNEEEKLQLFSKNQAPKYLQGLKSVEAKIDEPFRFTIKVAIPPEPTVLWYRDEQPVDECSRCHLGNEERGSFFLDIQNLEFMDQAEWKCVAMNDYGQSVTSCFLKLVIPRHYKKPRFLENLQAILSDEGAVNLECKVIGVPQPVLKWYKDGEELKPGDIHRIISGQDGTCCLGTYTCEAQNCMGIAASSASLLGFEDSLKAKNKKKTDEQTLQRNLSLSTIHEERTSQMYDTPVGDITLDDKGEISFSFDGKEVSVSLYETPDLTEEEALQIVEMYADQLSENVTEHNVVELPPLRFVKETSTSGNLLMEAIIIDVSPEYFTSPEEDLRTEADIEDMSIADENGPPQLSLDQDVSGEDYLEKTMALLSEERVDISKQIERKKSDSQKSVDDYFSLSRDRSSSEEKKDDDTQVLSESDLQSFASAHSTEKPKSKSSKPSLEDGQESSEFTKTVLLKEDVKSQLPENIKIQRQRRGSRGSRRSTSSEKSPLVLRKEVLEKEINKDEQRKIIAENIKIEMMSISSSLTKVMNAIQIIERDIILKSELMSVAATASRSLEIINSLISPLSEIHSITDTITETENESPEIICSLFNRLPQSLRILEQSLTIVEKCIDYESDNKTLVKKTCISLIDKCGDILNELIMTINTIAFKEYTFIDDICISNIKTASENILKTLKCSADASKQVKILNESLEDKIADISLESKHLHHTQKVLYAFKSSLKSVLSIIEGPDAICKSVSDIKNVNIILEEISTPIQELQNALEQIENLSVAESDSNLPKLNTEIIESVINPVLKLRTAFEQLSTDKENKINEVLLDIKQNIHSISSQLDLFEEKNGKFDILHNDNKLEVLQTMAQILISLENSLPILETIPDLKTHMSDFHKNLTKVLENVIEGNDSTKYYTLMDICNAVNRINTSLHNLESRQVLSFAIISNTLKIIQKSVYETIFENSLNKSLLKNIDDLMLDIQETINQVEESTLNVESEKVEDMSIKVYEKNKLITVLEHVQKTIVSVSKVVSFENVGNLTIAQVFENIQPILTEIQCCVASLNVNTIEHSENVTDMTISSFSEAIAHPLCELHQNISVLNEVLCEVAKNHEINQFTAFAEPLIELQRTLEILQTEVISQYEEIVQSPAILGSIANSVDNLQSCIVKIQEHDVLEVVDDMSTLDDISGIKTTADILMPSDQYMISSIENVKIEELSVIQPNIPQAFSAQALQKINKHILSLQNSVIAENVKTLPEDSDNLPIKSLILELELIGSNIEDILQPITMEVPQILSLNPSKYSSVVQQLEHLQKSLSAIYDRNIAFSKNVGETQTELLSENLLNLKADVDAFLNILQSAIEAVDVAVDAATKRVALRQLPEKLEVLLSECTDVPFDNILKVELINLHKDVLNAVDTELSHNMNGEEINEIIGKVNKTISKVQDEGFNCTAQSLDILSHESKLVETLSGMEQCIAILEQCQIPEEFVILTSETDKNLPQVASDTKVDPLIQLDQITKIVVNSINYEFNESSEKDIKLTEEFYDTFTKEILLLRYLIKNRPSPKNIIKSIQVFYALLSNLSEYKSRSNEPNKCLLADMENCLKDIKTILIEVIHSQSQLLFDIPLIKINDGEQFLKNVLKSKNDILLHKTCAVILNTVESSKPFDVNLKYKMIEELSSCENMIQQQEDEDFNDNYNNLLSFLTEQAKNSSEKPLKQITEKLLHTVQKQEDIKNILGVGRQIIFIQCLLDCIDLLKESSEEFKLKEGIEKSIPKEININELLLAVLEPLDCFNTQIIIIRNKIILASEKDIDIVDLRTLESHGNAIGKVNENIELSISNNEFPLDNNDVALLMELNNKIQLIFNNLKTLENTPIFETLKGVVIPVEEIEKNLQLIISYNKNVIDIKSLSNKEKAEALLQQMEQHIEIIEIVEEVSAVIRLDDLKETANIVREIKDNIASSECAIDSKVEECNSISTDKIPLTDKLQKALMSLHNQALDCAQQDTVNVKEDVRQQIIDAVSDLQNNFNKLTNISLDNEPESIILAKADVNQGENNQIVLNDNDKQSNKILRHDEINGELIESNQTVENIDDVSKQSTLKFNDDLQPLVSETKLLVVSDVNDLQIEEKCESKYNLSSDETSENVNASKSVIEIILENIQEYLSQDISEIAEQFVSCLNYETIEITRDISQQFYQETTASQIISDDQLKLLSNLHKNLEGLLTYEPVTELGTVVVEDKLLQFKNVVQKVCESIQNFNISTHNIIQSDKMEELATDNPEVTEPKTEVNGSESKNQKLSCDYAILKPNDANDDEVLVGQEDSKSEDMVINKNVSEYSSSVDANGKEYLRAVEDNLIQNLSGYVDEEVTEILKQTINTEQLEKSHQIADQLFTLSQVTNFDETNNSNILKEKTELSIQLNEYIMIIHDQIFDKIKDLPSLFEGDKLQKIETIFKKLSDSLQTYITFEQPTAIEQVIELDKSKQGLSEYPIVDESKLIADLVCIEEHNMLTTVNKEDDEISKSAITDKADDSLINNEVIESDNVIISTDHENETNSIQKLEKLLQEVNDNIDLAVTNVENSEIIQNNLDEVQSVIIKLKCDIDGTTNDALNETLEDLECNVRSVQLQINEQSPPVLLKEACSNLQVIVACLNNIEDVKETALVSKINIVINNCSEEADQTIQLLNKACCIETDIQLDNIISCLNNVNDIMKTLRTSFVGDTETLILKGIDIIQNLDQVEDKIFLLEKDMDKIKHIDDNIKDNIVTAMHSVYGSISNMRGAISSIQKRYMYENYGKPSQNFLKAIKNIADISQLNIDNISSWKNCAKFFRKVLNHFEDIKFYINLDRTARIPNDAAFTKIILREIVTVLDEIKNIHDINLDVRKSINDLSNYVNNKNLEIEEKTTLEVKEKIPIFKDLSIKILEATAVIKLKLEDNTGDVLTETLDSTFTQADDKEKFSLTDNNILTGQYEEVQQTFDLNIESAKYLLEDDKENKELIKVAAVGEDVLQKASDMETVAVNQILFDLADLQTNDKDQTGTDKNQVYFDEDVILKMPSQEDEKDDVVIEKSEPFQEDIVLTSVESQCLEDESYKNERVQLSSSKEFPNIAMDITTEQQNILTTVEIGDSQKIGENLLITKVTDKVEGQVVDTINIQEGYKCINEKGDQAKENQQSNNLKETNAREELSNQLTADTAITKDIQLNEHKGELTILENIPQVGLLTDNNLSVDNKSSIMEDHDHQSTDTNIEINLKLQERKTISETQSVDDIEIKKSDMCEQLQDNILLKNNENDSNLQMYESDTNEHIQQLNLSDGSDISEKIYSDVIVDQNKSQKEIIQNQTIDKEQKVELYEDISITRKAEDDTVNVETSIGSVLENTDASLFNTVKESKTDNKLKEQDVQKDLSLESGIQDNDNIIQEARKDSQDSTKSVNRNNLNVEDETCSKDIQYDIGKEEDIDHKEIVAKDNNCLVQDNINKSKTEKVILSSITDKIEADEEIKKTIEQDKKESLTNVQTDLYNKETEDTKTYPDHEKVIESKILENDVPKNNVDVQIMPINNQEQSVKIESDFKEVDMNKEDEMLIDKKKQEESVIFNPLESDMNVQSDLMNKDIFKSQTEQTETKEVIDVKCHRGETKASLETNENNELVNILKDIDLLQTKEQDQNDNKDESFPIDIKVKKEHSESELKAMLSKGVETSKENELVNIIKDMDIHQIKEQEQYDNKEESFPIDIKVKEEHSESELKAMLSKGVETSKENELVNIIKDMDIHQIKEQEQYDNKDESFPIDIKVKKEHLESEIKAMMSKGVETNKENELVNIIKDMDRHQIKEQEQYDDNKEESFAIDIKVKKEHSESELKAMMSKGVETNKENELVNIIKDMDRHQIKEQEQYDNKEESFPTDIIVKTEHSELKAMMSEVLDKDNKKDGQENIILKENDINKDDERLVDKKKQEESVKLDEPKSDNQIVFIESIEKDKQKHEVNVQSDLDNKDIAESQSEKLDTKNEDHEIVSILEDTDMHQIKEQELSDKKDEYLPTDTKVKEEHSGSELIAILETGNYKDDEKNLTSKESDVYKDDERLNYKKKQEELEKCIKPESDNEIAFIESLEKDKRKSDVIVQSDLENKETAERKSEKPETKEVIDLKTHYGDTKDIVEKDEDNELVNILEHTDIHHIKEQELFVQKEAEFPADMSVKAVVTEILEKDHKKDDQENISLPDIINKNLESSMDKEKQEDFVKFNQSQSGTQMVIRESIENDKQKQDIYVQSGSEKMESTEYMLENREAIETKLQTQEVIDAKSDEKDNKNPVNKRGENEIVNMFESKDVHPVKEKEQSSNKESNLPTNTRIKTEHLESEVKVIVTEILEKDDKDDQENITLRVGDIDKVDITLNDKEMQKESLKSNKVAGDIQIVSSEAIEKDGQVSDMNMQSDRESKAVTESKSISVDKNAKLEQNKEKELIVEDTNVYETENEDQSDKKKANFTKTIVIEKDSKEKDYQESTFLKDVINKDDESLICKEKKEECNKSESDNQVVFNELTIKGQLEQDVDVQPDVEKQKPDNDKENGNTIEELEMEKSSDSTDVKMKQEQYIKDNEEIHDKIIENKKPTHFESKDVICELTEEVYKMNFEENNILNQNAATKGQDIVNFEKSLENIQQKKEKEDAFINDEQPALRNGERIDEVGSVIDIHKTSQEIHDISNNNKTDYAINTLVENEFHESEKTPVIIQLENSNYIDVQEKYDKKDSNNVEISELKTDVKNKDARKILDENNENENINKSLKDSTSSCKRKESDFDSNDVIDQGINIQEITTINNLQVIDESNSTIEENKTKILEKTIDEDNVDKKTNEVNIQLDKNKKNGKRKQKSDKKKTPEKLKENNEEKSNIEVKSLIKEKDSSAKDEENKLFAKPLIQAEADDEQSKIMNVEENTFSMEEFKSVSTKHQKYSTDDIKSVAEDIPYSDTTKTKQYTTNADQFGNREYLVCNKSTDDTYERIDTEREKYHPKQSPKFIDHNKTDYTLQFPRPPNYTTKSFDNDELISSEINLVNRAPIYKAQTLMNDYQTRSSYSPHIDESSHNYGERSSARCRSKAVSESRSATSEKRATRDLKRKPVFSTFLTDRTAVESSRVKLTCSILSSNDPTITWYKNGILLDDKQKFRSKFIDGLITLEVLNAVPNDSGEYTCTVENEYGSVTSSANLKVYPSFEASPIPPTFTRSIRDVYHSFENELVLECRIRGQPLPSITWYKDDKPITLCDRYQAHYLADGVCRLTVSSPSKEDSGKYTCHAESSIWSDQIYHNVQFTEKESCISPNIFTLDKMRLNRQVIESRKPHFTNVISDYKVVSGGTIGLQVEIKGSPTRVEWLREGSSVTDTYRNAQTYVDHGIYTLALSDVTEKESGLYTCRAWSSHGNVDMNASIIVVQPNQIDGKPAVIVSRPAKDVLISIGEDINISFRVQGEPKPKVIFMKGLRDITHSQRVCKMTSDDYVKFTLKRSVISDAGTYCILARNAYGCDRAFVTVVIRQRATSENLVSDWTYPMDDLAMSALDRNYKAVPDRIPSEPSVVDGGKNWVSLAWPKPDCQTRAPILAYKVESWLIGKEGGARWVELGITPRNSFDAFNLKQEEEYHFRVTPRNRYGWGESVQTTSPVGIGLSGDRPEFIEILPGQLKVLLGETAILCCTFKGKPTPEILWMKNGHDIEEDTNRVKITLNSYKACLNIENVRIEDEGRYSCEASNIHGRSSTYARMTVITDRQIWEADAKLKRERSLGVEGEYPPQFTMRLRDRRVQATYPVRLTCQVIGSPAPVVTWFKNGEEVSADGRHTMSQDEYFYTLEIAPTTLDDGGVYEAMARNTSAAISCRCSLVVDKGIRAYVAPEFCCGLEPLYQLKEGDELRISAIVEAYPSVGVSWYRDGVRLRPSRRAIMTLDRDGQIELALASVTARDAGVYTCTASNEVGRVSTSGKVEIVGGESNIESFHAPPIFVSDESSSALYSNEPRFLRKPRSSEAREGDTVIIVCEVIGDPKPEVYWLRDFLKPDYYRDANHFKRVGAGPEYRFEIPHAKFDYTGAYSVVAKNIHGEAKAIISLQILARDPNSSQDAHNIRYGRVEVIPRFEKELTDLLCYDGDAIEFECRVSANPEPDIRWFHYSEVVPECPDFETSYDRGTARLKIKQVTAEDEGTYRCEASNSLGRATSSACLVVYPPGEPNTLSQRLRRPPALLSGASTPRSTPRTTPRNTPRTTPARSLSATPGPDSRRLCSPSREIAPKFYTYPFNRVVEEGDTVVFQCAVKGLPPPWATWDKDGIIITASSRITIKEKDETFRILEIEEVNIEDVGLYRITLENDYGRAEASARLEVISGKGKFHGTRSYSASPSRRALTYRRRTPSFSRQD